MTLPDLEISNLAKSFDGLAVLADVSLTVTGGTTTALLGPSGCGKTTLLRIVAGLETPERGEVAVGGQCLVGAGVFIAPERRKVGMVFQDGALFPHMSVAENVAYGLSKAQVAAGGVNDALAMVELTGFGDRRPAGLSGGEAQRVALARALAPQPDLLLLDEPFSSLDADLRVRVRADLVRLLTDLRITTIFVTHDQEEAFVVGERVAVMNAGQILQQGTPAQIYEEPRSEWLARFVGDANLLPAAAHTNGATTPIGVVPTQHPLDASGIALVRPEYLRVVAGDDATVTSVEFYGHDTSYQLEGLGEPLLVRELRAPRYRVGDRVGVAYAGGPAVVFPIEVQTPDSFPAPVQ